MNVLARWRAVSLGTQFLLAGGLISIAAMLLVGAFVTGLVKEAVTRNAAASTALYVDSIIAPLLPDMRRDDALPESVTRALDETLNFGALGQRIHSFRLWRRDGAILYSNDKSLQGRRFEPNENLKRAFAGEVVAEFDQMEGEEESVAEQASGLPLLEIYNPVLQPWSGEVVAVSEFYETAADLRQTLRRIELRSWLAVAVVTSVFFLLLSAIVLRGSRTIARQSLALRDQVTDLSDLLSQNFALRSRMHRASQRAAALNESYLRRIGSDLHDGPAQLLALAALRLDSDVVAGEDAPAAKRSAEIASIKASLDEAMREIRSICNGLVLPEIETAELPDILRRAVKAHEQRTGSSVDLSISPKTYPLPASVKICAYRFVQEGLSNCFRHAAGVGQKVVQKSRRGQVQIEVSDCGPGFDPDMVRRGSLGLAGLRERVESLGGRFEIETSGQGTRLRMSLGIDEVEQA